MRISRRQFSTAIMAVVVASPVGCASIGKKDDSQSLMAKEESFFDRLPKFGMKKQDDAPEPYPNPVKMAATWTPDTLVQTGRTPTRGFGGRVFFYDEKSRPVPVEGTLIVHGFDDSVDVANSPERSTKRFEFTPEQFTRHFSQTDLGASYSVWIPWDAMGGKQRRVSLVASFKTTEGKMVQGTPATVQLPGVEAPETRDQELARMSPQYREYQEATASAQSSSGLTTTTIARRRTPANLRTGSGDQPSLIVPEWNQPTSMMAKDSSTPAVDIQMLAKPRGSQILPASATIPVK